MTPGAARWLLLDRDDTILDDPGYLSDPQQVVFLPGAIEGLAAFSRAGWPLVVVSNQSGIGRGFFTPEELAAVHRRFNAELEQHGIRLAGLYVCPHAPGQGCQCRKPEPGLAWQASRDLGLSLEHAVMVGDKSSDLQMGRRIGAAYVAQIAARGQPALGADGCFPSLRELARHLLPP
jgi:histidinol-phosphate phosphatase family protein